MRFRTGDSSAVTCVPGRAVAETSRLALERLSARALDARRGGYAGPCQAVRTAWSGIDLCGAHLWEPPVRARSIPHHRQRGPVDASIQTWSNRAARPSAPSAHPSAQEPNKGFDHRTFSTANGIRTRVSAMRGRRPSPLDDSGARSSTEASKAPGASPPDAAADHRSSACSRLDTGLPGRAVGAISSLPHRHADVAELVDAHGSGPCPGNRVEVRVLSSAFLGEGIAPY